MSDLQTLAQLLDSIVIDGDNATATIAADWGQGRSIYGGVGAALGMKAMRSIVEAGRSPRSLLVSYIGPMSPGEVTITLELLREGRSASQAEARILQDGKICCTIQCCFGGDRESAVTIDAPARPDVAAPDSITPFPFIPGLTPEFTKMVDYRQTAGQFPFSNSKKDQLQGWVQFKDSADAPVEEMIVALGDAWPPTALQRVPKPAAASTLTWSLNFAPAAAHSPNAGWYFFDSTLEAAGNGYSQHRAMLWNPAGEVIATSHQSVAIFG